MALRLGYELRKLSEAFAFRTWRAPLGSSSSLQNRRVKQVRCETRHLRREHWPLGGLDSGGAIAGLREMERMHVLLRHQCARPSVIAS